MCVCAVHRFIAHGQLPHLLLYGPPGTGKTTVAMACARQMHGEDVSTMVLQLNASDDRGIEMVRSYVKGFASTAHLFKKGIKLVILDEADAMTPDAQAALRRSTYTRQTLFSSTKKSISIEIARVRSYGKVRCDDKVLPHLQLCGQDHSCAAVEVHPVSICPASTICCESHVGQGRPCGKVGLVTVVSGVPLWKMLCFLIFRNTAWTWLRVELTPLCG